MNLSKTTISIISFFFLVTIISEIFLVNQNLDQQKQLSSLLKMQPVLRAAQNELSLSQSEKQFRGLPLFKNENYISRKRYVLLLFFSMDDCSSCIDNEIYSLNSLLNEVDKEKCGIYGLPANAQNAEDLKQIKQIYRSRFNLLTTESPLFHPAYNREQSPLILFGDVQQNKVLYAFYPTPERKSEDHLLPIIKRYLDTKD